MGLKLARNIIFRPKFFLYLANIHSRGGVKLEFILNSFDSIRKFAIRLFPNGKKCLKNSMKINSKFVQINSIPTIGWNRIFQMLDSFEIRSIPFENL